MGYGHGLGAVGFVSYGSPQDVLQGRESHTRHRRYEHMGQVVGQLLLDFSHKLFIEKVALAYGEHTLLVHQLGIEAGKFVEQNLVLVADVVGIGRNHEQQHCVTLDVTQESKSKTLAFARTLDYTGDVGHYKRAVVAVAHYAKLRLHCGEGIVGNLGAGRRDG